MVYLDLLLDLLLVLVELLEFIKRGDGEVSEVLHVLDGLSSVLLISDEANLKSRSGHVGESDGSDETLILLGIVVLQTNLQVDGLDKFAFLGFLRILEDLADTLKESLLGDFACPEIEKNYTLEM